MSILQGIKSQGKYVQHFVAEVNVWEQQLGVTETVITDWLPVQNKWSSLQSIFVGSADIHEQLPDDSKRFDQIDADFKALQGVSQDVPIVLTSCKKKKTEKSNSRLRHPSVSMPRKASPYLGVDAMTAHNAPKGLV